MFMYYFMVALCIAFVVLLIMMPIMIAKTRGIGGGNLTTIIILSWLGIIVGVTWIVALIFSLIWPRDGDVSTHGISEVDKLAKLHKLKKSGAITQKEYDAAKKRMLK